MEENVVAAYKDKTYPNFKAMCDDLGISYAAYLMRRSRVPESVEQSVLFFLNKKNRPLIYKDETFPSQSALLNKYGVTINAVRHQMDAYQIDFLQAFERALEISKTKPKRKPKERKRTNQSFNVLNQKYKWKRDVCEKFNIDYNTFIHKTVRLGYTPEEAVLYTKIPEAKGILDEIKEEGYNYSLDSIEDDLLRLTIYSDIGLKINLMYHSSGGIIHLKTKIPVDEMSFERLNEINLRQIFGKYVILKGKKDPIQVEHRFSTMLHGKKDALFFVFMAIREVEKTEKTRRITEQQATEAV